MNSLNSTISTHQKGQHLALTDRVRLQVLRSQGQFLRQILVPSTVRPPRSRTSLNATGFLGITAKVRYDAQAAQRRYQIRRLNCGRKHAE